jgi:hypothetical protein
VFGARRISSVVAAVLATPKQKRRRVSRNPFPKTGFFDGIPTEPLPTLRLRRRSLRLFNSLRYFLDRIWLTITTPP